MVRGEAAADGIRVPASDLEALIERTVRIRLADRIWLLSCSAAGCDARLADRLLAAAREIAGERQGEFESRDRAADRDEEQASIFGIIERVTIGHERVSIEIATKALLEQLGAVDPRLTEVAAQSETIAIEAKAHRLRCGMQVRLIVGDAGTEQNSPDPRLIRLVEDAHRWFDELKSGRALSLSDIAQRGRVDLAVVSRTIGLAFLAPDLIAMILQGRQPPDLTGERLKQAMPLPLLWQEQRQLLRS